MFRKIAKKHCEFLKAEIAGFFPLALSVTFSYQKTYIYIHTQRERERFYNTKIFFLSSKPGWNLDFLTVCSLCLYFVME